ncbi:allantoate permease [Penicillium sp. IBT 16267x]|nr:allantoate permease [Penicillium sp. IBT 16267x]
MAGLEKEKISPAVGHDGLETEALKGSSGPGTVDAAYEFLRAEGSTVLSDIDEKRLVRKIDWMIMPLMWACYNLQYLDKVLINYASVMGLLTDTHIQTNQFSYLALAFYVTYLIFELPTGYLMQRLPTAKYLGANVALWGLITTMNSTAKNFGSLLALRIILGVFESCIAPSLILITSMWYKRHEQPPRMGLWYLGSGTAQIIGALVAYGLLFYTGKEFLNWQLMFLVIGLITITIGICIFLFLPDNPMTSRLTQEEKVWAIKRLSENKTGIENKHFKKEQSIEVFKDPQTYLIVIIMTAINVPNGAISSFSALIIHGFGFTTKQTELLTIPGGLISVSVILVATYLAGKYDQRCIVMISVLSVSLLGACLMAFSTGKPTQLAGNYLTNFITAAYPLLYSIAGANIAGHTKKVTMNAVLLMAFCLGNILGPLTFQTKDQPRYIPAKVAIVATVSVAIIFTILLWCYYANENRRRDTMPIQEHQENSEFLDLSDMQNPEFRYKQ